ncbi:MAG: CRISPR-associated endonuclease Cas2 [Firmicutes bacterium]|nr:CRISPR-associated endonuclease Cas2 [Bacillota bacterium]
MRIIVFFDLPTLTAKDRREYTRFRKFLIKSGFLMMQESVYCKLVLNSTAANAVISNVRKEKPESGLVQMLTITEKQFAKMEFVVGESSGEVLDNDERLVIL